MNGLEAVNKLKNESYCNCSLSDDNKFFCMGGLLKDSDELKAIEREVKVNKLLKEKRVDLAYIQYLIAIEKNVNSNFLYFYNFRTKNKLTQEEAQLIVDWLKGEL